MHSGGTHDRELIGDGPSLPSNSHVNLSPVAVAQVRVPPHRGWAKAARERLQREADPPRVTIACVDRSSALVCANDDSDQSLKALSSVPGLNDDRAITRNLEVGRTAIR